MSIDNVLEDLGIDWDVDVIGSLYKYIPYSYFLNEKIRRIEYNIPASDTGGYVYIDLSAYKLHAITNCITGKVDSPNLDFESAGIITTDTKYDKFTLAWHGKGFLVEKATEQYTLIVIIKAKDIEDNLSDDIHNDLKSCYQYLYTGDMDSFYIMLKALSSTKKNLINEVKDTNPVIRKKYTQIKLNPL